MAKMVKAQRFVRFWVPVLFWMLPLAGLSTLKTANAQGRPDVLWMKGLGNYVYGLYPSTDGLTSIKVTAAQNAGSTGSMVRRVNNADNTVLNTLLNISGWPTPDCLRILGFEDLTSAYNGVLKLRSTLDGSVIWSFPESVDMNWFKMSADGSWLGYLTYDAGLNAFVRVRRVSDGVVVFTTPFDGTFDFSPDGNYIAVTTGARVRTYTLPDGGVLNDWIFGTRVNTYGFTPDSQSLVVSHGSGQALYAVADGLLGQVFDGVGILHHGEPVWIGSTLCEYSQYSGADVIDTWTLGSSALVQRIPSPTNSSILNLARSFDNHLAMMGSQNGPVGFLRYFDPLTGSLLGEDDSSGGAIRSVALTSDGASIVTSGDDMVVRCYDRDSKVLRWRFSTGAPFGGPQPTIAISSDNSKVAVAPDYIGLPASILSMADGGVLQTIYDPNGDGITNAAFSPDASRLVTASAHTRLWSLNDGMLINSSYPSRCVAFSPNGQYVALALNNSVYFLNALDLSYVDNVGTANSVGAANGVSFSPDSSSLAFSQDGSLSCYQVSDRSRRWLINPDSGSIKIGPAVFSPDGHIVSSYRVGNGLDTTQLQFRDPTTGNITKYFDLETGLSWIVPAFSANGQFMAYGLADSTLVVANAPDLIPPVTTVSVTGSTVTLTATDAGSGVAATYYTLDGGAQQTYAGPFNVPMAGAHTLVYWSVDNAGNTEPQRTSNFTVGIAISVTATGATGPVGTKVTVSSLLKRTDTNKGLASKTVTYKLDGVTLGTKTTNASGASSFQLTVPDAQGNHALTVEFAGDAQFQPGTGSAQVTATAPLLSSLTLNPKSVNGGSSTTGKVTLTGTAAVDTVVTLNSDNGAATTPSTVTVTAGATDASFTVTTNPVSANTSVNLTASLNAVTKSAVLTVKAPVLSILSLSATSVTGGTGITGTVSLSGPVAVDTSIGISSANSAVHAPASVLVPAGTSSAAFGLTTDPVASNTAGAVKATLDTIMKSVNVTVKPPTYSTFTLTPNPVTGGNNVTGTVTMSGPVASDTTVTLTNANAKATLPGPSVTIPAGMASVSFTITTTVTSTNTAGAVKATIGIVTKSVTLTVKP